jgi:hypothetical protein
MTIDEFFHFEPAEYAARIPTYDLERLQKQEISKLRKQVYTTYSIAACAGGLVPTHGLSVIPGSIAFRRLVVGCQKFDLIQAELRKRGASLHSLQKRDILIPFFTALASLGIGFGLDSAMEAGVDILTGSSYASATPHILGDPRFVIPDDTMEQLEQMAQSGEKPTAEIMADRVGEEYVWFVMESVLDIGITPQNQLCRRAYASNVGCNQCQKHVTQGTI